MKTTIDFYDFERAFRNMDRYDQFGYDGLKALFEYLDELDESCGTETELDVIALCCDFTLYGDLNEFQANYGDECETIDDIEQQTTVIRVDDDSFIIQNF